MRQSTIIFTCYSIFGYALAQNAAASTNAISPPVFAPNTVTALAWPSVVPSTPNVNGGPRYSNTSSASTPNPAISDSPVSSNSNPSGNFTSSRTIALFPSSSESAWPSSILAAEGTPTPKGMVTMTNVVVATAGQPAPSGVGVSASAATTSAVSAAGSWRLGHGGQSSVAVYGVISWTAGWLMVGTLLVW